MRTVAVQSQSEHETLPPYRTSFDPKVNLCWPWLIVDLGCLHRIVGWPVIGPTRGFARYISWLQVEDCDLPRTVDPAAYFSSRARLDGVPADVGLLTAANIHRFAQHQTASATALVTAGLGNAESVIAPHGSPTQPLPHAVGTINCLALSPCPLSDGALLEALSVVSEARTAAILSLGLSTPDHRPLTGTGTDCIIVAAPSGSPSAPHCGLHTSWGQALADATYHATRTAGQNWQAATR